jgi:hypothetical protein
VRRREALEQRYAERERDLAKSLESKVKARVAAALARENARENARGPVFTEAQFKRIWSCLHPDSRTAISEQALSRSFQLFQEARPRLVSKDKSKQETTTTTTAPAPRPTAAEPTAAEPEPQRENPMTSQHPVAPVPTAEG